ncbi:MAG: alpha/beta hydrolase, partial [Sphingobacteriales bacterium]
YQGDFAGTPILISSGDPDPHVPVSRVHESEAILKEMGAQLTVKLYPGRQHTITNLEVQDAATQIANS